MHRETFELCDYENPKDKNKDMYIVLDPEIAPSVGLLNRKGYFTAGCCAGHPPIYYQSYIGFTRGISLPSLPPGFTMDKYFQIDNRDYDENGVDLKSGIFSEEALDFIRKPESQKNIVISIWRRYDSDSDIHVHRKVMEDLYEWALDLPDFKS